MGKKWELTGNVKLPAHRAVLPGKEISFLIVPPDPTSKGGGCGTLAGQMVRLHRLAFRNKFFQNHRHHLLLILNRKKCHF